MKSFLFILSLCLCFQGNASIQDSLDYKLGKKTFEMVKQTYGIYQNDSLLAIIKEVGQQLEKNLSFSQPLQYFLVDTPEPNAFATAGGYVYVTRGLLAILNSKDELAGIMGHEISHVTQRHPQKMMEAKLIPLILELPGQLAGVISGPVMGGLIKMPVQITSGIALASFSRKQEKEADLLGAQLAIKSGFEPYGLVVGLENLTRYIEAYLHHKMPKNLLIDHPTTEDRVAYLTEVLQSQGYYRKPTPSGTNIFSLNELLYGQNNIYGCVKDSLYIHPSYGVMSIMPKGWKQDVSNNIFTCLSKDKKSSIHVDFDTLKISFAEYVLRYKSKIASKYIISIDSNLTGGLPYYKMEIYFPTKNVKAWIGLYECKESKSVARFVGVTQNTEDNTSEIKQSVFEVTTYSPSLLPISSRYIELVPASMIKEWTEISSDTNETKDKMLQIMNGVKDTNQLNTSRLYYKKIKTAY